jgi:hypothetical protein
MNGAHHLSVAILIVGSSVAISGVLTTKISPGNPSILHFLLFLHQARFVVFISTQTGSYFLSNIARYHRIGLHQYTILLQALLTMGKSKV